MRRQYGTWAFRFVNLFVGLSVGYAVLWVDRDIDTKLNKELANYVRIDQLESYKSYHDRWVADIVSRLDRIENKVDRLAEKRTASVITTNDLDMFVGLIPGIKLSPFYGNTNRHPATQPAVGAGLTP